MKCDNNSIYELQDRKYMAYKVPLAILYNTSADIFRISKIHSSELIILWFWRFLQKK